MDNVWADAVTYGGFEREFPVLPFTRGKCILRALFRSFLTLKCCQNGIPKASTVVRQWDLGGETIGFAG